MGGAKARPASRLSGGLAPARGRSDLPILSRHARSGVPSSVASSQRYSSRINAPQSTTPAGGRFLPVKNSAAKASKGRHVKALPCPKPDPPALFQRAQAAKPFRPCQGPSVKAPQFTLRSAKSTSETEPALPPWPSVAGHAEEVLAGARVL